MDNQSERDGTSDDFYETSFSFLIRSLNVLKKSPISQCVEMDYCNVAWFIKDDFLRRVNMLMNEPYMCLSAHQIKDICILTSLVGSVPCKVTRAPNNKADQELSMKHACWEPIRAKSQLLLDVLDDEIRRVNDILWGDPNK